MENNERSPHKRLRSSKFDEEPQPSGKAELENRTAPVPMDFENGSGIQIGGHEKRKYTKRNSYLQLDDLNFGFDMFTQIKLRRSQGLSKDAGPEEPPQKETGAKQSPKPYIVDRKPAKDTKKGATVKSPAIDEPVIKRKSGRPKKNPSPESTPVLIDIKDEDDVEGNEEDDEEKEGRDVETRGRILRSKRGPAPKVQPKEESSSESSSSEESDDIDEESGSDDESDSDEESGSASGSDSDGSDSDSDMDSLDAFYSNVFLEKRGQVRKEVFCLRRKRYVSTRSSQGGRGRRSIGVVKEELTETPLKPKVTKADKELITNNYFLNSLNDTDAAVPETKIADEEFKIESALDEINLFGFERKPLRERLRARPAPAPTPVPVVPAKKPGKKLGRPPGRPGRKPGRKPRVAKSEKREVVKEEEEDEEEEEGEEEEEEEEEEESEEQDEENKEEEDDDIIEEEILEEDDYENPDIEEEEDFEIVVKKPRVKSDSVKSDASENGEKVEKGNEDEVESTSGPSSPKRKKKSKEEKRKRRKEKERRKREKRKERKRLERESEIGMGDDGEEGGDGEEDEGADKMDVDEASGAESREGSEKESDSERRRRKRHKKKKHKKRSHRRHRSSSSGSEGGDGEELDPDERDRYKKEKRERRRLKKERKKEEKARKRKRSDEEEVNGDAIASSVDAPPAKRQRMEENVGVAPMTTLIMPPLNPALQALFMDIPDVSALANPDPMQVDSVPKVDNSIGEGIALPANDEGSDLDSEEGQRRKEKRRLKKERRREKRKRRKEKKEQKRREKKERKKQKKLRKVMERPEEGEKDPEEKEASGGLSSEGSDNDLGNENSKQQKRRGRPPKPKPKPVEYLEEIVIPLSEDLERERTNGEVIQLPITPTGSIFARKKCSSIGPDKILQNSSASILSSTQGITVLDALTPDQLAVNMAEEEKVAGKNWLGRELEVYWGFPANGRGYYKGIITGFRRARDDTEYRVYYREAKFYEWEVVDEGFRFLDQNLEIEVDKVIDLRKQRGVYEPLALLAAEQRRRVRHTNVGNNYQVDLSAALARKLDTSDDDRTGDLLWDPSAIAAEKVAEFLKRTEWTESIPPSPFLTGRHDTQIWNHDKKIITQEKALEKLRRYHYNVDKAVSKMESKGLQWSLYAPPILSEWSSKEVSTFEAAMKKNPKEWRVVSQKVGDKSPMEVIDFYYYWHMSQRYKDWKVMYRPQPSVGWSNMTLSHLVVPSLDQLSDRPRLRQRPRVEYNPGTMKRHKKKSDGNDLHASHDAGDGDYEKVEMVEKVEARHNTSAPFPRNTSMPFQFGALPAHLPGAVPPPSTFTMAALANFNMAPLPFPPVPLPMMQLPMPNTPMQMQMQMHCQLPMHHQMQMQQLSMQLPMHPMQMPMSMPIPMPMTMPLPMPGLPHAEPDPLAEDAAALALASLF